MIEVVVQLIIWTAIFKQADVVRGYSYDQMMTYVIVGWLILFITSNYGFERSVARDIHIGTLSNYLIKPVSYLKYIVVLAIGRSSLAMLSGVFIRLTRSNMLERPLKKIEDLRNQKAIGLDEEIKLDEVSLL